MSDERPSGHVGHRAFDAVLLDAAGTLIAPAVPVAETYVDLAREFGADPDPATLSRAFAEALAAMPALAFPFKSDEELHRLEYEWWRTLEARVVQRSGMTVDRFDGYFDRLYAYYASGAAWVCYPEVRIVLQQLRTDGYRVVVVSNFDSRLTGIFEDLGIEAFFDGVIYSSRAGSAKPDPDIFRQALSLASVAAERAVHVGDNPRADMDGARAMGIDGLLVDRTSRPRRAARDAVIDDLTGLLVRLQRDTEAHR